MGLMSNRVSQSCIACAINSGPLSDLMYSGLPWRRSSGYSASSTSSAPHSYCNRHAQCLAGIFIKNSQHLVSTPVAQLVVHEVDAPHMVRMRRAQPDNRAVLVIQASAFLMPLRQLQPLFPPQSLNLLVVHLPALDTE